MSHKRRPYATWNPEQKRKHLALGKAWYQKNRQHARELSYNRNLQYKYGISRDEYDAMVEAQGGRCAVCLQEPVVKNHRGLIVDHDHETGKVRALLCKRCNTGVGYIKDFRLLAAAHEYLARHGRG